MRSPSSVVFPGLLSLALLFSGSTVTQAKPSSAVVTLKRGRRGAAVRGLQQALKDLGYTIKVDGIFGRETDRVLRQFQKDQGLKSDGVAGRATQTALQAALNASKPKPPVPVASEAAAIRKLIADNRDAFGVTRSLESISAKFYSKGRSTSLRVLKVSNIEHYLKTDRASDAHIQRALGQFDKSGLSTYDSGRDMSLVLALANRESGAGVFRTDSQQVVSGGKDTHSRGASGLDNLWKLRSYFTLSDGQKIGLRNVSKNDPGLKKPNRSPAWIAARDLMFAHLVTSANHEKAFRNRLIKLRLDKLGITTRPETLFNGLSKDARRAWMCLHYSGYGYVLMTLEFILKRQQQASQPYDLNAILSIDIRPFRHRSRVILARATALRAKIRDEIR